MAPQPPTLTKDLTIGRKLAPGAGGVGLGVAFPEEMTLDESKMSIVIPYADGNRRDGVGDLLEIGGIDFSRHRKNPVHLFDHGKSVTLPLGKTEDPETGQYTGTVDLLAKTASDLVYFYQGKGLVGTDRTIEKDHALFCEQVYDLLAKKFIRAGSIGYQVQHAQPLPADASNGTPAGLHLLNVLKLESSSVVLPANADTVRKMLCLPSVCGKPLSPWLRKSLEPYDTAKSVQINGGVGSGEKAVETVNQSFSTREQAERFGKAEADKLTRRGYPTRFVGVVEERVTTEGYEHQPNTSIREDRRTANVSTVYKYQIETTEGKSVPVPLKDVPDTQIPHSKWKPGAGAMKDIRAKYRKKAAPTQQKAITREDYDKYVVVEAVANPGRGKLPYRLVDKMTGQTIAQGKTPDDPWLQEMRENYYRRNGVKSVEKSIKSIRVKYRNKLVKGYANIELKFDTSKLTTDQLDAFAKDMMAIGCGKPSGGRWSEGKDAKLLSPLKKACFTADLEPGKAVHEMLAKAHAIAAKHGAKYLGNAAEQKAQPQPTQPSTGTKSMKSQRNKSALKYRKKDAETAAEDAMEGAAATEDVPLDPEANGEIDTPTEKLGAEVLRRVHEHHLILMADYDEALAQLENESVKKYLTGILEDIEAKLSEAEDLFADQYPDLDPIEGVGEKDMDGGGDDDDSDVSDSGEEDVPPPEDVVEGMATEDEKGLRHGKGKTYPRYTRKHLPKSSKKNAGDLCPSCGAGNGYEPTPDGIPGPDQNAGNSGVKEWVKQLTQDDVGVIGGASGFLREASEHQGEWNDEMRTKAGGWHKSLDPLGLTEANQADTPVPADPESEAGPADVNGEMGGSEMMSSEMEMKGSNPGALQGASQSRRRAAMARMRENDELDDFDDDKAMTPNATKALKEVFTKQADDVKALQQQVERLTKVLAGTSTNGNGHH